MKRVFLIVLDSFGAGQAPDAEKFGDKGASTIKAAAASEMFHLTEMGKMGLFNIDGIDAESPVNDPSAAHMKLRELSVGKDTTTGHFEIAGIVSKTPFPTYPNGFPKEIIEKFEKATGRRVLCNKPYSGTQVIKDYGREHIKTGDLIVYTSADSVFQIAAHEDIVSPEKLYEYCRMARQILQGNNAVGRVIARPFIGEYPNFERTPNRHDFSLAPPEGTMLDNIKKAGKSVIAVGKIGDIFAHTGTTEEIPTKGNADGMAKTLLIAQRDFDGLVFLNLVDFDMLYGHRRNPDGYAAALTEFDGWLFNFLPHLREDDILMITADHGCDPSKTDSTDHTREYIPLIVYGKSIKPVNLGIRNGFSDIGATVCDFLGAEQPENGKSFLKEMMV